MSKIGFFNKKNVFRKKASACFDSDIFLKDS